MGELQDMKVDTTVLGLDAQRAQEEPSIASMGIYVFNARKMIELLTETFPTANDFGSEVIPGANRMGMKVQAHLFDGYWEDIGTIKAFYESNLALCDAANPSFSFYDKDYPIYTMTRFLPPSKLVECNVERHDRRRLRDPPRDLRYGLHGGPPLPDREQLHHRGGPHHGRRLLRDARGVRARGRVHPHGHRVEHDP